VDTQRSCKLCGDIFEIERKVGHPRVYCWRCEPEGFSVVFVAGGRTRLRRRTPLVSRSQLEQSWGLKPPVA
jgi:hypothetical protein